MKKTISLLLTTLFVLFANAQIATWLIPPRYNHMQLVPGTTIYKGQINDSTYLWNINGKQLLGTKYYVGPFVDKVAVVADGRTLMGIINTSGTYIALNDVNHKYEIDTKYPQFSGGYLLVKSDDYYYFLDKEGRVALGPYGEAYPFCTGTTSVLAYENPQKRKGELRMLIRSDMSPVVFSVNDKAVNYDDVTFCSVLNEQNKSIVIVKKDVYLFDDEEKTLVRLSSDGSGNKKTLLSLPQSEVILNPQPDGAFSIVLNKGEVFFDKYCVLTKIVLEGMSEPKIYERSKPVERPVNKQLEVCASKDGSVFGVNWFAGEKQNVNILPPQFSDVSDIIETNAVVCLKDKYGVVTVDRNSKFVFTLNNGNDIGFAHGKYPSNVQVALPGHISWQNTVMSVNKEDRCEILPVSRTGADTREGNYLKYDCNLYIPEGLTENRVERNYRFSINYDGLQSPDYNVKARVWYIQQYEVNIEKQGVKADTIWAQVSVRKKIESEVDNSYWFNVDISSKVHMSKSMKKIDENTYMFRIYDIPDGVSEVSIDVNEDNCPPVRFSYSMIFNRGGSKGGSVRFVKKE